MNTYRETFVPSTLPLPIPLYCGRRERTRFHRYNSVKDHFLIICVEEGEAEIFLNGVPHRVKQNEILFVFPFVRQSYQAENWAIQWFGVTGEGVETLLARVGITPESPVLHAAADLRHLFDRAWSASEKDEFTAYSGVSSAVLELFSVLSERSCQQPLLDSAVVLAYLERTVSLGLSMEQVAAHFHLSRNRLSNIVKEQTGLSLKQHGMQMRLKLAKRLLASSDLSVTETATACGVENIYWFSRCFRRQTGLTPSEYRTLTQSERDSGEKDGNGERI